MMLKEENYLLAVLTQNEHNYTYIHINQNMPTIEIK